MMNLQYQFCAVCAQLCILSIIVFYIIFAEVTTVFFKFYVCFKIKPGEKRLDSIFSEIY